MDNGGGNGVGCIKVKIWTDTAKFTNAIVARFRKCRNFILYIIIHHNMIERTEQKVQQKSTHKKRIKITTMEQVTQIYI